jgi:hypothetical protein
MNPAADLQVLGPAFFRGSAGDAPRPRKARKGKEDMGNVRGMRQKRSTGKKEEIRRQICLGLI